MISDTFCSFHDIFRRSSMKVGFPLPKVAEVESHSDHASINRRWSLISPSLRCASLMLQHLFPLIKNMSLRSSSQWCNNITATSVSSATTTTWFFLPTLKKSKQFYYRHHLPLQTKTSWESALKKVDSNVINSFLLLGFERKCSFEYRFW